MSDTITKDSTDIIYSLKKSILYAPKGSGVEVEGTFVTLKEPSVKQLKVCSTLKQAFMRTIANSVDEDSEKEKEKPDESMPMPSLIINALYAGEMDMSVVLLSAKELFREVGFIEGEKQLTIPMLDSMSLDDIESMTGVYMENFILASVLEEQ